MTATAVTKGRLALLVMAGFEGLFAVFANTTSQVAPPLTFLLYATIFAALLLGAYSAAVHESLALQYRRTYWLVGIVSLGITIRFVVAFLVSPLTSSINTTLLLQSELLWTYLIATFYLKETLLRQQKFGLLLLVGGLLLVLFHGSDQLTALHIADIILLIMPVILPFTNRVAQFTLQELTPVQLLFWRYVMAVPLLLFCLFSFGESAVIPITTAVMLRLVIFSVCVLILAKVCWYLGLRVLPLGETVYIASIQPVFGLLFAILLVGETPSFWQLLGCSLCVLGIMQLSRRKTVSSA